jgi:hypothetical protein
MDPYELTSGCVLNDPSVWPDFPFGDIYCYIIESPSPALAASSIHQGEPVSLQVSGSL